MIVPPDASWRGQTSRLKYSEKSNRVFISEKDCILVFNPRTRKIEAQLPTHEKEQKAAISISEFIILEEDNRAPKILSIDFDSELSLRGVTKRNEKGAIRIHLNLYLDEYDHVRMSICSKHRFVLIDHYIPSDDPEGYKSFPTHYMVEIGENSMVLKHSIVCKNIFCDFSQPLFYNYLSEKHLIFTQIYYDMMIAVSGSTPYRRKGHFIGVIDYNIRTGEMRFIKTDGRLDTYEDATLRLIKNKNDNNLVFASSYWGNLKISQIFNSSLPLLTE